MMTIPWHLLVLTLIVVCLLWKAFQSMDDFDLRPLLYFFAAVALVLLYGGIFWW